MKKRKSIYDEPWDGMHTDDLQRAVDRFRQSQERRGPMAYSKDSPLPYPHYTDDYWNTARLIYGNEQKCTEVNYSDRLWQWDGAAADRAAKAVPDMRTPAATEAWLSAYHGKPVLLRYIMAGCNAATGYAYYVYGYDYASSS